MSFSAVLTQIKKALEEDTILAAFVQAKWEKPLTVKITWRNREEISASDLPLIMITRPTLSSSRDTYQKITGKSVVRFYAGFYQNDEDLRQLELVEFEEQIFDAVARSEELKSMINSMTPAGGANDEGALGDTCFTIQQIEIETRR